MKDVQVIVMSCHNNSKGFTLIELMIAVIILTIGMIGLLDVMTRYTQINLDNVMRNEAMRISEARMEQLRNVPVSTLANVDGIVTRAFRKMNINFTVETRITVLSPSSRAVRVQVIWLSKGITHRHNAATVMTEEL
jgi:type IV pilus assembly protein PilV